VRVLPLFVAVQLLAAQQPVFRSDVDLATIDVTVVDKDGRPIAGLKPEDFVVTLNRQARPVRALDYIEAGVASSAPTGAAATPATKTNPAAPAGRTVLILFDDLSYKPGLGKGLTQAGLRILPSFGAGDVIGLVTTSGLGPKVNPTRDHAPIAEALRSKTLVGRNTDNTEPFYIGLDEALTIERDAEKQTLTDVVARECTIVMALDPNRRNPSVPPTFDPNGPCPSLVESEARAYARQTINRTNDQVAAYLAAIAALKPAPAPRVIVALTAGLALSNEHGDLQSQMESVKHAASDAGVEFYALSEVADDADPIAPERAKARRAEGRFLNDGIQTVSSTAGGETFSVVGTADRFFGRILTETSAFYRLGIELPEARRSERYLGAKVSVLKPGAVVRTHTEAIVTAVSASPSPSPPPAGGAFDDQLRGTIERGGVVSGVPILVTTALRRDPDPAGHLQLTVGAQIPASARGPLTAMFALTNEAGAVIKQARVNVPSEASGPDYLLTFPVPLDPGAYHLRFAVADAAGTIGMVTEPIAARLARIGAYSASELLRTWTDNAGAPHPLVLDTVPQTAVKFRVALELYPDDPAAPRTGLSVRLSLMSTTAVGEESPIVTTTLVPVRKGEMLSIAADLPASAVPDGICVIHAVVLQDGEPVGEVSSSIQKMPSSGGRP
jgi:VWFA-related protein